MDVASDWKLYGGVSCGGFGPVVQNSRAALSEFNGALSESSFNLEFMVNFNLINTSRDRDYASKYVKRIPKL